MVADAKDVDMPARRMLTRRGARSTGGFSSSGASASSSAESYRGSEDPDDSVIDPDEMQDRVLSRAEFRPPVTQPAPSPTAFLQEDPSAGMPDPRQRMNQVAAAGSSAYSKEYRLTLLHRLLIRNVPLDQIAQQLQVSISTVEKDRATLRQRLIDRSRNLDINEVIGDQSGLYDEISGMALRLASLDTTPTAMKLAAMRTSLAANADRTRMLQSTGVLDVLRYRRSENNSDMSDVQRLMARTSEMLEALGSPEPEEEAPTRVRRTRSAPVGFKPFSMEDQDASSGDNEEVEL